MNTQNTNKTVIQPVMVCCAHSTSRAIFWGIVLIVLGGLGFLNTLVPLRHLGSYVLPALLVLWGGFILFNIRQQAGRDR